VDAGARVKHNVNFDTAIFTDANDMRGSYHTALWGF